MKPSEKFITAISERSASLTIKRVGRRDCGRYTCRLRDSASEVRVEFNLSLNHRPSPPRGPTQVSWKIKDTLVLQWRVPKTDGGAKIEEYIVERKEVGREAWTQVG